MLPNSLTKDDALQSIQAQPLLALAQLFQQEMKIQNLQRPMDSTTLIRKQMAWMTVQNWLLILKDLKKNRVALKQDQKKVLTISFCIAMRKSTIASPEMVARSERHHIIGRKGKVESSIHGFSLQHK